MSAAASVPGASEEMLYEGRGVGIPVSGPAAHVFMSNRVLVLHGLGSLTPIIIVNRSVANLKHLRVSDWY